MYQALCDVPGIQMMSNIQPFPTRSFLVGVGKVSKAAVKSHCAGFHDKASTGRFGALR